MLSNIHVESGLSSHLPFLNVVQVDRVRSFSLLTPHQVHLSSFVPHQPPRHFFEISFSLFFNLIIFNLKMMLFYASSLKVRLSLLFVSPPLKVSLFVLFILRLGFFCSFVLWFEVTLCYIFFEVGSLCFLSWNCVLFVLCSLFKGIRFYLFFVKARLYFH